MPYGKGIVDRVRREPLVLRAFVMATVDLLKVAGIVDTGAGPETEAIALAVFNLLLIKGARDRVTPMPKAPRPRVLAPHSIVPMQVVKTSLAPVDPPKPATIIADAPVRL